MYDNKIKNTLLFENKGNKKESSEIQNKKSEGIVIK